MQLILQAICCNHERLSDSVIYCDLQERGETAAHLPVCTLSPQPPMPLYLLLLILLIMNSNNMLHMLDRCGDVKYLFYKVQYDADCAQHVSPVSSVSYITGYGDVVSLSHHHCDWITLAESDFVSQVLAPFAIGFAVFVAHLCAIPLDGCSINRTPHNLFVVANAYMLCNWTKATKICVHILFNSFLPYHSCSLLWTCGHLRTLEGPMAVSCQTFSMIFTISNALKINK